MDKEKEQYKKYAAAHAPKSPLLKDSLRAFWVGGGICALGEGLILIYERVGKLHHTEAGTLASVTLIFLAAVLSAVGIFDKIAKYAGAGTLVPITGFSNAVASPAIDSKSEGLVLGVGAKIFTVAGPVLLYGTIAGTAYGAIYYVVGRIFF